MGWSASDELIIRRWWADDELMMSKWWVDDEQMMSGWWAHDERMMSRWWADDEQMMSRWWANDERMMSRWWADDERMMSGWWAGPSGYPNPTRYPVFHSIPDPTRFSFENHRVAGNPKYRVLPDISGKPEVSGITRYFGYSQTWLGISGITPPQSWVLVGGKLFVNFCNVRKKP